MLCGLDRDSKVSQGYWPNTHDRTLKFLFQKEVHLCAETSRAQPGSTFTGAKGGTEGLLLTKELRVAAFGAKDVEVKPKPPPPPPTP